jgi:tetratricopeptide (TPR) repeat protein
MLGSRLRRLRLARGLTQKELASPRYTHAYVSTIEAGRRQPSRQAVEFFADKLGVHVDELLTGRPPGLAARLELRLLEARIALSAGQLDEAEQVFKAVGREAKRFQLKRIEGAAEEGRGLLLERLSKPEEALEHYQRAEEIVRSEPPTVRVDAVDGKARCFTSLGDVRYAIFLLESLLDELERENIHDPNALARIHSGLVFSYLDAGLYQRASDSALELERLAPNLTDPLRVASMHMNVARLYLTQGRIDDALRSLGRAEDAYRQLDLKTDMGYAHLARGYVLSRENQLGSARDELDQALAVFQETGDQKNLTRALNELARVQRLEGEPDQAQELLERSIELTGSTDTPILAWAHRELGLVLLDRDPAAAEKNFRVAIDLYERSEQPVELAVTYRALGDLMHAKGNRDAGCDAYRTGILALEPHL